MTKPAGTICDCSLARLMRECGLLFFALVLMTGELKSDPIRIGITGLPPDKVNPHGALIDYLGTWSAIFDPLTLVTNEGELRPWLAIEWQQENPTTWIITLRNGVTFSNGRPFEASSVVHAITYLNSPAGQGDSVARSLSFIESAEALDPRRIKIITREPRPVLPYDLQLLRIPDSDTLRQPGNVSTALLPIGTGPFAVERWAADEVILEAVPSSWRRPAAQGLTLKAVADPISRLNGFLTGQFDIIFGLAPDMVPDVQASGGSVTQGAVPGAMAIIFNTVKDERFRDPKVRQALNLGVNKAAIIEMLFAGLAEPASQPAHRMVIGHNPDITPYPYDPDRARALLAEAGYPNGLTFVLEASNESSQNLNAYQQIAIDLARVGVEMRIQLLPRPQYLDKFQTGAWDGSAFPLGYFSASLDGLSIVRGNSCLHPNGWYCDEAIVPLINEAIIEPSLERRIELTRRLMTYSHETAIGLFLYEAVTLSALQPRVSGYSAHGPYVLYEHLRQTD